jgi:hypothetical protein
MRERFSQSAAFQSLFVELIENEAVVAQFINDVMPKEVAKAAKAEGTLTKLPPPPPTNT